MCELIREILGAYRYDKGVFPALAARTLALVWTDVQHSVVKIVWFAYYRVCQRGSPSSMTDRNEADRQGKERE